MMNTKPSKTFIFAHRGNKAYYPENTMAAFKSALDLHSDGIELDVHLSKDGQLMVIHDETIDRTTNGVGKIKDMDVEQLKSFSAGLWFADRFENEKIPTLNEVFELLKEENFSGTLNIELKTDIEAYPGLVDKVLQLEKDFQPSWNIVYSSFNLYTLLEMHQKDATKQLAFLMEDNQFIDYLHHLPFEAWHPSTRFFKNLHQKIAYQDMRIYTVNDDDLMIECFQLGVKAIFTDDPQKGILLRGESDA